MTEFATSLLALDTTGRSCSAAVWHDGRIAGRRLEAMARGQSERLVPMVEEVMAEAALAFTDLEAIAVTLGPGGFTGVRIGLAAAQGFALAWDLPLIGVSSFEAVAAATPAAARSGRTLAVLLESKRSDFFIQLFGADLATLSAPAAVVPGDLARSLPTGPLLLAGDAAARARSLLAARCDLVVRSGESAIDAAAVARVASVRPLPGDKSRRPAPLYLRAPDVTLPRPRD
ncbi:MAG TPA: tRNA (adenosine(37)-N6)-threonylcarbamoyltransferase complex dimerization subunit type 1 TsaB [Kiloniellaceae bacterium]|nr:tRNA (adenosine(37)-N6)-threonylcarbamoyltransferase complex dimerization subunit type 1 TsaB [Kiloniellaceae bacterium]